MCTALLAVLAIIISSAAPAQAAAPQAVIDGPDAVATGEPVGFGADRSSDPDGDPLSYAWSIDGKPVGVEHDWLAVSFSYAGRHVVSVVVTDASGASTEVQHPVLVTGEDRVVTSPLPFGTSALTLRRPAPELVVRPLRLKAKRPLPVKAKRRTLRLELRCRKAAVCKGRLRAVSLVGELERPLLLSKRRFTVQRGGPRVVRMWLSRKAQRRLAAHPRIRVTAYRGKVRVAHIWASYAYRVR